MKNNEIINGIDAIQQITNAYNALIDDVEKSSQFTLAAENIVNLMFTQNTGLKKAQLIANIEDGILSELGYSRTPIRAPQGIREIISKYIPYLFDGNAITVPVKVDYSKPFSVVIESVGGDHTASMLSEHILFSSLKQNSGLSFRCVDLASGGSFYTSALTLISKFSTRSGGKVFSKREDFSDLLQELETAAEKAMAQLGGKYDSVWSYNDKNQDKIQQFINVIRLGATDYFRDEINRLKVLIQNSPRNGMNFVIICDNNLLEEFDNSNCLQFVVQNQDVSLGISAKLPFVVTIGNQDTTQLIAELNTSMQQAEKIDTLYENHSELHSDFFTMDSTSALRIPFAIDKFNRVQYFEIGGNAPSHALIAGSTGSGKSSLLHTLIMQTMHHYHPDDVEIWAIDYKAVEFNFYIQNPTPHFRVIAHDTTTEFSLSLIDLLYKEYENRQQRFLETNVKDIEAYRRKFGKHSMPRILVVIDEFQLMTQAVMEYNGYKDYRTELENLLRLTRAMGISFVFSSQTIASGLAGLSSAARDQIGCRLCLKHEDDNEIRETLTLSGPDSNAIVYQAKELRRGQGTYKRARWANEHSPDGKGYELLQSHILFLNEGVRGNMIGEINRIIGDQYTPKDTITVRGGGRLALDEKVRHPIQKFISMDYEPDRECVEWYPAAPASLADYFRVGLEQTAGANILMIGELDDLRDSVVLHSICGFLMNPQTKVIANFIDEQNPDRKRLIEILRNIQSHRLGIRVGVDAVTETIHSLQKIRPSYGSNTIYLWYGLDKLKNAIFLKMQDGGAADNTTVDKDLPSPDRIQFEVPEDKLLDFINQLDTTSDMSAIPFVKGEKKPNKPDELLNYDQCISILKTAYDAGPENGHIHMVVFNNMKSLKRLKLIESSSFEHILATKISMDDSYDLFGTGSAIKKADNDTIVYSSGGDKVTPLRPYVLPNKNWFKIFNRALEFIG